MEIFCTRKSMCKYKNFKYFQMSADIYKKQRIKADAYSLFTKGLRSKLWIAYIEFFFSKPFIMSFPSFI